MCASQQCRFWVERSGAPDARHLRFLLHFLAPLLLFLVWLPGCTEQTQMDALFCPEDGCASRLIAEIAGSTESVHVAIYYFSHPDIADALIEAHERGVDVKVLGDGDANYSEQYGPGNNYETVQRLKEAGVSYRDDGNAAIMHNKFAIIDGAMVLTGSFNYTLSADESNNENLVVLVSTRMADAFEREFQYLWSYGVE